MDNMKTIEEVSKMSPNGVDIQSEVGKIIAQYGNTEMGRYRMQIFAEKLSEISFKKGVEFAQRWIPVGEELPKVDEKGYSKNVLICDDPQDEDDERIGYRITDIGTGVTHWNNNEHPAYWRTI